MTTLDLPGGAISHRPLRFYWMIDVSGSMQGEKIGQLNYAIREALPAMRDSADDNPHAAVEVRAMTFGTGARWLTPNPVPLADFTWTDATVSGITDMGAAMKLMARELSVGNMPDRGLPPVIVLVSDGQPTDDFNGGLKELLDQPWGKRAVRIAVGIGDADLDVLRKFIAHPEIEPLTARNPGDLTQFIKYASTVVLKSASSPASQPVGSTLTGTPPPPPPPPAVDDDQVW